MKRNKNNSKRKKELQEIGETIDAKPITQAMRDKATLKRKGISNSLKGKQSMRLDSKTIVYAENEAKCKAMIELINENKK